jgi:hypothetical protein
MTKNCTSCGRSESQIIADAKALGLQQEVQSGIYTCCQISEWADEQWSAWFEAAHEDATYADEVTRRHRFGEVEPALVPVRFQRRQVPWYRNPDNLT